MFVGNWGTGAFVAIAVAACVASCGGAGSNGPSRDPSSPADPSIVTITITSSGASPKDVVISPGDRVMFVNRDSRVHEMYSDPHPEHTDCPEFDQVGSLEAGESRATGNLNRVRVCGFHDHINFENLSLRGTVTIQ